MWSLNIASTVKNVSRMTADTSGLLCKTKIFNETFRGDEIDVKVEEAWLRVRVIDMFGRLLDGAKVSVFYGLTPLQKSVTGADGTAYFKRLLKLPTYTVHVRHRSNEERLYARPNEIVEAKMNIIQLENIRPLLQYVVAIGVIAVVVTISVKLILYVRSAIRSVTEIHTKTDVKEQKPQQCG